MATDNSDQQLARWFYELPFEVRYCFSSQWMISEAARISNPKLADFLTDDKRSSEALIKSFRSFDVENNRLKKSWRPDKGFTTDDVHQVCNAINGYRESIDRAEKVSTSEFYRRAWDELHQQYPLKNKSLEPEVVSSESSTTIALSEKSSSLAMIMIALALLMVVLLFFLSDEAPDHVTNEQQSYRQYLPGNVVQLRQLEQSEQPMILQPPEHYLSAKDCYPNLTPEFQPSAIISFNQLQALPLTAQEHKTTLLPHLSINEVGLRSSSVSFDGLNRWNIAKGMINIGISKTCMASMQQMIDYGNHIDDYAIIKQTYVADSIRFELVFTEQTSEAQISQLSDNITTFFDGASVNVVSGQTGQGITRQITINGPVTVAYISQPMSARIKR